MLSRGLWCNLETFKLHTVDWKKSCDHQLRLVVYPTVYRVLYILGGAGFLPQQYHSLCKKLTGGMSGKETNRQSEWMLKFNHRCNYLSNEKNLGWLGYIGDEILPSYIGIIS